MISVNVAMHVDQVDTHYDVMPEIEGRVGAIFAQEQDHVLMVGPNVMPEDEKNYSLFVAIDVDEADLHDDPAVLAAELATQLKQVPIIATFPAKIAVWVRRVNGFYSEV